MRIPGLCGVGHIWNVMWISLVEDDSFVGGCFSDWQVVVSRENRVLEVKQMSIDMPNTRLKPIYSTTGDLTIVILAESRKAAENRGQKIATRIADAGLWGLDFLDLMELQFDK